MFRRFLFVAIALVLVAVAIASVQRPATVATAAAPAAAPPTSDSEVAKGERLSADPTVRPNAPSAFHKAERDLRATGNKLAQSVPLPHGVTLDDIDWKAAEEQGGDSEAGMKNVIEFRAACKWYAFAISAAPPHRSTQAVIRSIAKWPTFRESVNRPVAEQIAAALDAGDVEPANEELALNCR